MNRAIPSGSQFQSLIDVLVGTATVNLANKNVNAGQNSLVHPALSTAGDYAVNGVIATVAASSTMFALEETNIPAYGGMGFVCCLNAAGSGIGYATNVLTSAQVSAASSVTGGAACANILASSELIMPAIPATMCPVGIYVVAAGDSAHVAGSETFSAATSNAGSHAYTQILNMNQVS